MSDFIAELKRRNVLRVGAAYLIGSWLVLQIIDVVFPMLGLDESFARPILIVLILGFPAVLTFAWLFELTPQGLKKEKEVDRSKSVTAQTGRKLDRIIIVVLVGAIGMLLLDKFVLQQADAPVVAEAGVLDSVAVLPFVNMSGAEENEYFSDGLTETLLHMLAQVPELKVAARTSAFAFKGRDEDIRQIADALDVSTILEGSVQRAGNTVRITAQLIEADSGFHLWSRTFDRDLDDIFSVQDEIANSVADALKATLLGDSGEAPVQLVGVGTTNTEAYEMFLRGLEQKNIGSYGSLPQAEAMFKQALVMDPGFIEAKLELAATYDWQADTGLITRPEADALSRPLLEQVIAVNPGHGRAQGYLAAIEFGETVRATGFTRETVEQAMGEIERAISLAPSEPDLYLMMAGLARGLRDFELAVQWFDKGLERDPLAAELHWERGGVLLWDMDDPVPAEASFRRALDLAPEWTAPYGALADAARIRGNFADSLRWDLEAMALDPQDHELPVRIGEFYYLLGLLDEGDDMLARARVLAPDAPVTRKLELQGHRISGNVERARLLSRQMILDDIPNRHEAWTTAIQAYVASEFELGNAAGIPDTFESITPGISSPDFDAQGFRNRFKRFFIAVAFTNTGEYERANAINEPIAEWFETNTPGFEDNHGARSSIALVRGDIDTAVEQALLDLEKPLGRQLDWRINYMDAGWNSEVVNDSRVVSRLAELNAETMAAADEVRQFLAERDATR